MDSDPTEALFLALARVEDAVSRLDEQVRLSPVGPALLRRLDFHDAWGWAWGDGKMAPLEDLVLHDARMDVRAPTQDLTLAHGVVRARRKAMAGGLELISPEGALWVAGRSPAPPIPAEPRRQTEPRPDDLGVVAGLELLLSRASRGETSDATTALADWCALLWTLSDHAPDLLAAAAAVEAWRVINPLPREPYVGAILAAVWLRGRGRVRSHLLPWCWAAQRLGPLPAALASGPVSARLRRQLDAAGLAGRLGVEELQRLGLARQVLMRRVGDRRRHSKAAALIELLISEPLISAGLAAERLNVSQQAVRSLISELGAGVTEITGRRRFQAWRV